MNKLMDRAKNNIAWVLLIICMIFFSFSPNFLTIRNILNILNQNAYVLVAAFGISLIMMSGGIDLSTGYLMSITGVISAKLLTEAGMPLAVVLILTICAATGLCVLNAVFSHLLGIPRIFVTFGTMTIYQGLAYVLSGSKTISVYSDAYKYFGQGTLFGTNFSFALLVTVILGLLTSFILNKTYFGRYIFALGGNQDAARLAGINVKKWKFTFQF